MNKKSKMSKVLLMGLALFLTSIACQSLFPKVIAPGSLEEQVAAGDIRFEGSGNVTYIGCQDPTAIVSIYIGPKTKEINGVSFVDYVNPVTVNVITNGTQVMNQVCEKIDVDEKYNWPANGIYYPKKDEIIFTNCTQFGHEAKGNGFLVGDGFEGAYTCNDKDGGGLMFEVAFSAYQMTK